MNARYLKAAVVLISLCLCTPLPSGAEPGLVCEEQIYDFGCVGFDLRVFHNYKLINRSSDTIEIYSVGTTCDCSSIQLLDSVVYPGDTVSFRLEFNTTNYYGRMNLSVNVHSSDAKNPQMKLYFTSTVGRWQYRVSPEPVSLFFLPGHKAKTATMLNAILDYIEVAKIELHDDLMTVTPMKKKAAKGDKVKLQVTPRSDLAAGTYFTNFRVTFDVPGDYEPLLITIPVKIVRY